MLYGWYLALVLVVIGAIQSQQWSETKENTTASENYLLAREVLMVANSISLYRFNNPEKKSLPALSKIPGVSFAPDKKIKWKIKDDRVWVWVPDEPGLMDALQAHSRHSFLLGTSKGGRFLLSDGTDSGLSPPSGIPEGHIVYLN